ncbi:murein hydrolase activator EnvC family protein [Arthrobacter sp. RIT-PI-e]|uniref:murein hydrolase activator EnvC family protein n=1 Tax=Arthrobacter sp. RIT-PI-e TaxID=1681197 RepID=UPI001F1F3804|nr:M23 family metallopeptidase [Arthrobacter sp. RIT-PI-e]
MLVVLALLQPGATAPSAAGLPEGGGPSTGGEYRNAAAGTGFVAPWSWPLEPVPEVLRPFDKPAQDWRPGHRGVDLAPAGAVPGIVSSPAAGVVSFAGTVVDRGVVSIDHGDGRISSFEPVDPSVTRGQRVEEGQAVATVARPSTEGTRSPHCTACLHWGVRVDGEYVDPLGFVTDRRPSVLLPLHG